MPSDVPVRCPAGSAIADLPGGGRGVRCRIAHETIDARTNARTFAHLCCGAYEGCTTFQEDAKRGKELHAELAEEGSTDRALPPIIVARG